jgi:hypothetical protein
MLGEEHHAAVRRDMAVGDVEAVARVAEVAPPELVTTADDE